MKAHELILIPGNNLRSDCVSQEAGLLIARDGHFEQLVLGLPFLSLDFAWLAMPLQRLVTKVKADSWTSYQVNSISELSSVLPSPPSPCPDTWARELVPKQLPAGKGRGQGCLSIGVEPRVGKPSLSTAYGCKSGVILGLAWTINF